MPDRLDASDSDRSDDPPAARSGPGNPEPVQWPVWIALAVIGGVFTAGAVWSFREQTALARSAAFHVPELLPLAIDGFAVAMAAVAWAASLDGRAAVFARFGIGAGIACSAGTNAAWAWERSGADPLTVALGGGIPVLTMVAFEVLLAEVRRQVQRRRGLPRPEPVPWPRLIAVGLAPWSTLLTWRRLVLERTSPLRQFADADTAPADRSATVEAAGPKPRTDRPAYRSGTSATVTPITRSTKRRNAKSGTRRTGHSESAIRDARALLDRYGDTLPARNRINVDMGWGSPRTGKAVEAIPAVRRGDADRSGDDDREGDAWAV